MPEGDTDVRLAPDEAELGLSELQLEQVRALLTRQLEEAPIEALPAPPTEPTRAPPVPEGIEPRQLTMFPWILFALPITAIERTQATQYLLINGKGSSYAADNSVPLVVGKELVLRV